jgi:signal transduction histidine kinase/ActR/RegA family two-component response regulator
LVIVIPALSFSLLAELNERRNEKQRVQDGAVALSVLAAANQESVVRNTRQLLATLNQFPLLLISSNRSFSENHLSNLRQLLPDYCDFGLIETNGVLFCSTEPWTNSVYLGDRAYFQRVVQTKQFSVGDFQISRLTKEPVLNFAAPVLDQQGRLARILYASLKLSRLSESIERIRVPESGAISVLDRNGSVLARQPNPEQAFGKPLASPATLKAILTQRRGATEVEGPDRVPRLYAVEQVLIGDAPGLWVTTEVPLTVLYAHANELLFRRLLLLAAAAGGILLVVYTYAKRLLLKPVKTLAAVARRLAAGDLAVRAGKIGGAQELVQLAGVLDSMAQRVQARTKELVDANDVLLREMAERKKAEEQVRREKEEKQTLEEQILRSQRMDSLGALAGGIAHDLNNALVPVVIGSHILLEGGDSKADRNELLRLIESGGKRCTSLVKQMVTFARGSSEKNSSVPLRHLIQEMAGIARSTFPKNIEVQRHFPAELWNVEGNATELHQILLNLCVNSRDAMPNGGLLVMSADNMVLSEQHLPANSGALPGSYVMMSVSDTGSGIPPEVRSRLFEPFFTTKSPGKGTGLGLSTVASIVKRHKGFIEVKSEVGKGTEFKTFIPAVPVVVPSSPDAESSSLPFGHGELILFVDDEKSILEVGKTALENYGYAVIAANNGLEAVACFELHKQQISLIVMDTDMPYLDGLGATQTIRKTVADMPIILATANPDNAILARPELAHIPCLAKPYAIPDLLREVAQVLRGTSEMRTSPSLTITH